MRSIFVILFIFLLSSGVSAVPEQGTFTKHYKESFFKVSDKGHYSIEMMVKEHALHVGSNKLDLIIHDNKDHDVVGAVIQIIPWMPEMGQGVKEKATITEKGGGLYQAENVVLSMGGLWELKITVKADSVGDTAIFTFPDVPSGSGHEHHMHMGKEMGPIDTSTTVITDNFNVHYENDTKPIPDNTFLSGKLRITTHDGKPVTGAIITIEGDMPIHEHGLPTEPEITEENEDGVYLIEGLKFSMPGHWVMKFHIEADGKKDTAAFNIMVQ